MVEEKLLTYALLNGELLHVSEVANGLACNCICPSCSHPLVAKNNPANIKLPHFAHHKSPECIGAYETALHLLSKKIFSELKQLYLPDYHHDYNQYNRSSKFSGKRTIKRLIQFEHVELEVLISQNESVVIPDAVAKIGKSEIFVEFANTHFIDLNKADKLKTLGKACIEIDINGLELNKDSIKSLLLEPSERKSWISNPKMDAVYARHKDLREEKKKHKEALMRMEYNERIKQSWKKINDYEKDFAVKVFKAYKDNVSECPKKIKALEILKTEHFYSHPILKKIIDGVYWNGQIYGYKPNGSAFYFEGNRHELYPADGQVWEKEKMIEAKILYKGLKTLQSILESEEYGNCISCDSLLDQIQIENRHFRVCEFHTTI